jgi:hypothetical protein
MLPLQLPQEAVRDLLGNHARALPCGGSQVTPRPRRLERFQQIGQLFREALEMGLRCAPDSLGRRSAISQAEQATELLGQVVADSELLEAAVDTTAERLRRRGRQP